MSEWVSVLAVFWILWALDGVRLMPRRIFSVIGGVFDRRARASFSRLSLPGALPLSWRLNAADLPLALSPIGVVNRAAGSAGRPAEKSPTVRGWRWEDIREVGVARGWIYVNGEVFCADTGQIKAADLLTLARAKPAERERRIRTLIRWSFRPAHLRRRARVLKGRTMLPGWLNVVTFVGFIGLTIYVAGDIASRLPVVWSERLADRLPWLLLGLLGLHLTAVVSACQAKRKLRAMAPDKRGAALFSALLLPPQAMKLRGLLGEGFFPAQHPLAVVLAFGGRASRDEVALNVLADLEWPMPEMLPTPLADEVLAWFRAALKGQVMIELERAGLSPSGMLTAPTPDTPNSCSYCPRCRDQFVDRRSICPNGVTLLPLRGKAGEQNASSTLA